MRSESQYIVVTGNIGSGKTTLTRLLAENLDYQAFFEDALRSPLWERFYHDMLRWKFALEVHLLAEEAKLTLQAADTLAKSLSVVQDFWLHFRAHVLIKGSFVCGEMTREEYDVLLDLFDVLSRRLPVPDLVIYLASCPTRVKRRLQLRGVWQTEHIPLSVLKQYHLLLEEWVEHLTLCPVLRIDWDEVSLCGPEADRDVIRTVDTVRKHLDPSQP